MPKIGTKNALFGYFCAIILKTIVIFEISTLKFVKNDSLTHRVNIGIGSAFSKDLGSAFSKTPGSAFSEDPGPGSGPLYKVCLSK